MKEMENKLEKGVKDENVMPPSLGIFFLHPTGLTQFILKKSKELNFEKMDANLWVATGIFIDSTKYAIYGALAGLVAYQIFY